MRIRGADFGFGPTKPTLRLLGPKYLIESSKHLVRLEQKTKHAKHTSKQWQEDAATDAISVRYTQVYQSTTHVDNMDINELNSQPKLWCAFCISENHTRSHHRKNARRSKTPSIPAGILIHTEEIQEPLGSTSQYEAMSEISLKQYAQ